MCGFICGDNNGNIAFLASVISQVGCDVIVACGYGCVFNNNNDMSYTCSRLGFTDQTTCVPCVCQVPYNAVDLIHPVNDLIFFLRGSGGGGGVNIKHATVGYYTNLRWCVCVWLASIHTGPSLVGIHVRLCRNNRRSLFTS